MKQYYLPLLLLHYFILLKEGEAQEKPIAISSIVEDIDGPFILVSAENKAESADYIAASTYLSQVVELETDLYNAIKKEEEGHYKVGEKGEELEKILIKGERLKERLQVLNELIKDPEIYEKLLSDIGVMVEDIRQKYSKIINTPQGNSQDSIQDIIALLNEIKKKKEALQNEYYDLLKGVPNNSKIDRNKIPLFIEDINEMLQYVQHPQANIFYFLNNISKSIGGLRLEYFNTLKEFSYDSRGARARIFDTINNLNLIDSFIPWHTKGFSPFPEKEVLRIHLNQVKFTEEKKQRISDIIKRAKEIINKYKNEIPRLKKIEGKRISLSDLKKKKEETLIVRKEQCRQIEGFFKEADQLGFSLCAEYKTSPADIYKALIEETRRLEIEIRLLSIYSAGNSFMKSRDRLKLQERIRETAEESSPLYMPELLRTYFDSKVADELNGINNLFFYKRQNKRKEGILGVQGKFYQQEENRRGSVLAEKKKEEIQEKLEKDWMEL